LKKLLVLLATLAAALPPSRAQADGLQVEPLIGDMPMRCYDFRGAVVRMATMTDLGDVGRALIIQRMPIIALDPDRMRSLPPKMQVFFYVHECAHHVLGHNYHPTASSETEADCWAIQYGRDSGYFTRTDVEGFAPYFARSKGSPFGHLPGPERETFLLRCFDERATESASNR
jgi:hypothetical protein